MEIKNKNFICKKMQIKDIKEAFECKKPFEFAYSLIGEGYMRKVGDRYFQPTEKLLNEIFLPIQVHLNEYQRRYFTYNSHYYKGDIIDIFGGDLQAEQILKKLIIEGYILMDDSKRYRKSTDFEDLLADGEDVISWKGDE